ncbi:hypothetical protein [Candidatus Pandoraea novymonadis]|uniref:hypothetical protein n=1 Tax=Candidatus Pandoraea novymonadis TaxID=1808959 RepID=UPI0015E6E3C9|nr:hypothetical protein [Candidatus Pandoraea novymonadis]
MTGLTISVQTYILKSSQYDVVIVTIYRLWALPIRIAHHLDVPLEPRVTNE